MATESSPKATRSVSTDELRAFLQNKVDRKALLSLEPTAPVIKDEPIVPTSELENKMAAIITEIVGVPNIRVNQNFFDAGATSLHIVIIAKRLREKLDLDVPVTLLFPSPNIRALAAAMASSNPHEVSIDKAQEREARRKARLRR